jgi:hypothetical protein
MDPKRKAWNDRHKMLRQAIIIGDGKTTLNTFLIQHAMVHSPRMSSASFSSFEDEILDGLPLESFRVIPPNSKHSVAWIIWHMARVEDVTMNLLIADAPQILLRDNWPYKLKIRTVHTGNGMAAWEVHDLSQKIDIAQLRLYRMAVGRETRKIIKRIKPEEYQQKTYPSRLQRIWDEHAMLPKAKAIVEYWAKRTIGGLLLMPPTRHCFLHLNEARRFKETLIKKGKRRT